MESQELSKNSSPIFQNITIHSAKIIGIGTNYHPLITDITKWDLWMGKIKNKNWNVWRYVKLLIPSLSVVTEFACSWLLFNQYHCYFIWKSVLLRLLSSVPKNVKKKQDSFVLTPFIDHWAQNIAGAQCKWHEHNSDWSHILPLS